MQRDVGDRTFPIWLLGDSNPRNWADKLDTPFDARHPARHNVWTSIVDVIQDRVYRDAKKRVDTTRLYIRNAIESATDKPRRKDAVWQSDVSEKVDAFRQLLNSEQLPKIIFSFGAFAYEFGRRALDRPPAHFGHWGAQTLGDEFRNAVAAFQHDVINLIPLLHISISGGKFLESHRAFCQIDEANYFQYVGEQLGRLVLSHEQSLNIWIA